MSTPLDRTWTSKPEIIRSYYDKLPVQERLCEEIKYILSEKIKSCGIEVGNLSSRTKSLASFCEKIERKAYKDPLKEIKDFSGVRVVYLYGSDRIKLEKVVEDEFNVHEKVDKVSDKGVEQFGYGALHYIVSIKEQHAGARYDDLREVLCEIQIRTILQDAWAIAAHHLSYKHEADIPKELKRKLHALAGLFETADDQFEGINLARLDYQNKVKESIISNSELSLETNINLDNLLGYMKWRFPDRESSSQDAAADLLEELNQFGYKKLKDIDEMINKSWDAIIACESKYPPQDPNEEEPGEYVGVGLIRVAMEFTNKDYLSSRDYDLSRKRFAEFLRLLK